MMAIWTTPIGFLRAMALTEGVSFLLLLGIAMPLKYVAGMPTAVRIVGWLHGVLFVLFCAALVRATLATGWSWGRAALVFAAALVPFGPFVIDPRLRREEMDANPSVLPNVHPNR